MDKQWTCEQLLNALIKKDRYYDQAFELFYEQYMMPQFGQYYSDPDQEAQWEEFDLVYDWSTRIWGHPEYWHGKEAVSKTLLADFFQLFSRCQEEYQILAAIRRGGNAEEAAWKTMQEQKRSGYMKRINELGGTDEQVREVWSTVVMNVFRQVKKPNWTPERSSFQWYFAVCVEREWKKARIKQKPNPEFQSPVQPEYTDNMEVVAYVKTLESALDQLGERCKKILLLHGDDYSHIEMAELMEWRHGDGTPNEQTAKNEVRDCRFKLFTLLFRTVHNQLDTACFNILHHRLVEKMNYGTIAEKFEWLNERGEPDEIRVRDKVNSCSLKCLKLLTDNGRQ